MNIEAQLKAMGLRNTAENRRMLEARAMPAGFGGAGASAGGLKWYVPIATDVPPAWRFNLFHVAANLALADVYDAARVKSTLAPDRWGMTWAPRSGLYVDFLARKGVRAWGGEDVVGRLTGRLIESLNPAGTRDRWVDIRQDGFVVHVLVPYAESFHRGLANSDLGFRLTPVPRPLWPDPVPVADVRRWHDEAWQRVRGKRPKPVPQDPGPSRASYAASRLRGTQWDGDGQRVLRKLRAIGNFHDRQGLKALVNQMPPAQFADTISRIRALLTPDEVAWLVDYLK